MIFLGDTKCIPSDDIKERWVHISKTLLIIFGKGIACNHKPYEVKHYNDENLTCVSYICKSVTMNYLSSRFLTFQYLNETRLEKNPKNTGQGTLRVLSIMNIRTNDLEYQSY